MKIRTVAQLASTYKDLYMAHDSSQVHQSVMAANIAWIIWGPTIVASDLKEVEQLTALQIALTKV